MDNCQNKEFQYQDVYNNQPQFSLLVQVKFTQSYPTLCDPVDYRAHGILQARMLEWVAFPFSRGSSQPKIRVCVTLVCVFSRSVVSDSQLVDCSLPGSSVVGVSRQEYWSGLPFPSPGDLPHPGIKPRSPALQSDSLMTELRGKPSE